jgi:CRP-like cAMP-binding protein
MTHFYNTTTGSNQQPENDILEMTFTCVMLFMGIIIFAAIIGGASSLLSSLDAFAEKRNSEMACIDQYLHRRRVPHDLKQRIRGYYNYLWMTQQSSHHKSLFTNLPKSLQLPLQVAMKRDMMTSVGMFQKLSSSTILSLLRRLQTMIFLPHEIVIEEGEEGHEMYFIEHGKAEVLHLDHDQTHIVKVATLIRGSYFGEISLLQKHSIRTQTVKTITHSEMDMLTQKDFDELLERCEDLRASVLKLASRRISQDMGNVALPSSSVRTQKMRNEMRRETNESQLALDMVESLTQQSRMSLKPKYKKFTSIKSRLPTSSKIRKPVPSKRVLDAHEEEEEAEAAAAATHHNKHSEPPAKSTGKILPLVQ